MLLGFAAGSCAGAAKEQPGALYGNEGERMVACLELQDHSVRLFADAYLRDTDSHPTDDEHEEFVESYGRQLEEGGALKKWRRVCMEGLTRETLRCGIRAESTTEFERCAKGESK
jgi:hypothetical protein